MHNKSRGGFTLVEMLCAIVVLILVSMLMVTGVRLGVDSYAKSVSYSEAQVLCSTLKTTVSDELRYSGSVLLDADDKVTPKGFFSQTYTNQSNPNQFPGFSQDENGRVLLGGNKLLPNKSYPYGLKASVTLESYDKTTRVFHVKITVTRTTQTLAETEFDVQQLNAPTTYHYTDGTKSSVGAATGN